MSKRTLESKVRYRINRSKSNVFLLADFADLSDRNQVGRVLRGLVKDGIVVKIGYGLYAKAKYNRFMGQIAPSLSLPELTREALSKLNIKTGPTRFEKLYMDGKSTQVPTGRVIGVKDRFSRKIGFGEMEIKYEQVPTTW